MEKFEQQFEDLDVQTAVMDTAMQSTTAGTMPEGQVEMLMTQVAEEHGSVLGVIIYSLFIYLNHNSLCAVSQPGHEHGAGLAHHAQWSPCRVETARAGCADRASRAFAPKHRVSAFLLYHV